MPGALLPVAVLVCVQMGAAMGLGLSVILAISLPFLPHAFTSDAGVIREMNVILPVSPLPCCTGFYWSRRKNEA